MIRKINVCGNWFGCVHVIPLYVTKVFSESVTQSAICFTKNIFLHIVQGMLEMTLMEMHVK